MRKRTLEAKDKQVEEDFKEKDKIIKEMQTEQKVKHEEFNQKLNQANKDLYKSQLKSN